MIGKIIRSELFFTIVWLPFLGLFGGFLRKRMNMDKELLAKELGAEADLSIALVAGKLELKLSYDGKGAGASVAVNLEPDYFIEKLAAVIPGKLDDAVLEILKSALKS